MRDLRALPKAHLHVHLESTVRPETSLELGGPGGRGGPFATFRDFADHRAQVRERLTEPAHFRRIAREFCEDEAAQGTRYAEVSFTAAAHGDRLGDPAMPLEAVLEGLAEGRGYGIETRVILDHSRRRPVERLWQTLKLAQRHPEVIAIGLAGDEAYGLAPFTGVFDAAHEAGIHLVHHAGEAAGPESIRDALGPGRAERIGHGIRILDDPALTAEVAAAGIPLEVCPSSNVLLKLVPSLPEHPLPRLLEAGLLVTINTDGEADLAGEYRLLREVFGYGDAVLAGLAANGVRASFAPGGLKDEMLTGIARWLA
ncbi:adenosine deaminase [Nonomuraea typhae]|uniref:Adenosine deaminase n=1 Tax=Nonomuraea typhae TaxID=2603600 RepID=A0ABW7Z9H8_9ACTN